MLHAATCDVSALADEIVVPATRPRVPVRCAEQDRPNWLEYRVRRPTIDEDGYSVYAIVL
jgi:hypothetical protein